MGKWDKIIAQHRLARATAEDPEDPKFQEKVDAVKAAIKLEEGFKQQGSYLADMYQDVRIEESAYKDLLRDTNLRKVALEQLLDAQYEVEGVTSISLSDGASVRVQLEPHAKVIDKIALRKWAIADGLENDLTLPWQTTNAILKQRLEAGLSEPDGVEAKARAKVVWTKAR